MFAIASAVLGQSSADFLTTRGEGSGAVPRSVQEKLRDVPSIMDFQGVDPTGVASSSGGIQAAINQAQIDGKALIWPAGTYNVSGLSIPTSSTNLHFRMIAQGQVKLVCTGSGVDCISVIATTFADPVYEFDGDWELDGPDLNLSTPCATTTSGYGFRVSGLSAAPRLVINGDLHVMGFCGQAGIFLESLENWRAGNISAEFNGTGLQMHGVTSCHLDNLKLANNVNYGGYWTGTFPPYACKVDLAVVQSNYGAGLWLSGNKSITFDTAYFENNDQDYKMTSTSSSTLGTGSKTFAVASCGRWVAADPININYTTDPGTDFESGTVTSCVAGSLVADITFTHGSGTFTAWNLNRSAYALVLDCTNGAIDGLSFRGSHFTTISDGIYINGCSGKPVINTIFTGGNNNGGAYPLVTITSIFEFGNDFHIFASKARIAGWNHSDYFQYFGDQSEDPSGLAPVALTAHTLAAGATTIDCSLGSYFKTANTSGTPGTIAQTTNCLNGLPIYVLVGDQHTSFANGSGSGRLLVPFPGPNPCGAIDQAIYTITYDSGFGFAFLGPANCINGVTAGTYGTNVKPAIVTVDAQGHVTSASTSATTMAVDGANTSSGTTGITVFTACTSSAVPPGGGTPSISCSSTVTDPGHLHVQN